MRINNSGRSERVGSKAGPRKSGATSSGFSLNGTGQAQQASAPRAAQGIAGVEALLAIQSVGDATSGRARAVRRGHSMLDVLEDLRLDLLAGVISPARLERLLRIVNERGADSGDPRIDGVLAEIELRARVELAKHERS